MALDHDEASAVQAVLNHLLGRPGVDGEPVAEASARDAALDLADRARQVIGRGLTSQGVAESWPEPVTERAVAGEARGNGRSVVVQVIERVAPERRTGKKATMWVRLSPDLDEAEWVDTGDASFTCRVGDTITAGVKLEIGGGMNPRVDRDIIDLIVTGEPTDSVAIGPRAANFTLAGVTRA